MAVCYVQDTAGVPTKYSPGTIPVSSDLVGKDSSTSINVQSSVIRHDGVPNQAGVPKSRFWHTIIPVRCIHVLYKHSACREHVRALFSCR